MPHAWQQKLLGTRYAKTGLADMKIGVADALGLANSIEAMLREVNVLCVREAGKKSQRRSDQRGPSHLPAHALSSDPAAIDSVRFWVVVSVKGDPFIASRLL